MWKGKWRALNGFQRGCLLLQAALVLLSALLYSVTQQREGMAYGDEFFPKTVQGDATVYTGKRNGHKATYTVRETGRVYTVDCRIGDESFGTYTVREVSTSGMALGDWNHIDHGVEIWQGDQLLFRGGYFWSNGSGILVDENGKMESGFHFNVNGVEKPIEAPDIDTLFSFTVGAVTTHRGNGLYYWLGVLTAALNAASILFAEELFVWNMSWRIQDPERAEPSDWELFSRYFGWCFLSVMALCLFLYGLFSIV